MVSNKSLSDSKSLQVTRTRLSILTDLNNDVFLMVLICFLIPMYSSPFCNTLRIVQEHQLKSASQLPLMFHCFFSSFDRV